MRQFKGSWGKKRQRCYILTGGTQPGSSEMLSGQK